jgi:hypothetical protein
MQCAKLAVALLTLGLATIPPTANADGSAVTAPVTRKSLRELAMGAGRVSKVFVWFMAQGRCTEPTTSPPFTRERLIGFFSTPEEMEEDAIPSRLSAFKLRITLKNECARGFMPLEYSTLPSDDFDRAWDHYKRLRILGQKNLDLSVDVDP